MLKNLMRLWLKGHQSWNQDTNDYFRIMALGVVEIEGHIRRVKVNEVENIAFSLEKVLFFK